MWLKALRRRRRRRWKGRKEKKRAMTEEHVSYEVIGKRLFVCEGGGGGLELDEAIS